ncbi:MAG: Stp1/IreP family PP2C-type Ser/Thr phosphatase [Clostridia bacterium]|nr:Stp1/IreP family PP2C-type Ser/Thr phosphatase [Clostridia bacterium]
MECIAKTDKGLVRSSNQDSFAFGKMADFVWAVVCDGMGGTSGGSIASEMTVSRFKDTAENMGLAVSRSKDAFHTSAINSANALIFDKANNDADLKGMGTTVVSVVVSDGVAYIAHVGDSRAYYIKDGKVSFVTKDHSMLQSLVETGKISDDEAKNYKHKNIITRAVGVGKSVDIDFDVVDAPCGYILLCTDGLTNLLSEETICQIITDDYPSSAEKLVEAANEQGGYDNITALVIKL